MSPDGSTLRLLAFDHRGSLLSGLFGVHGSPTEAQAAKVRGLKEIILDGVLLAREQADERAGIGILVDEQFGAGVARRAAEQDLLLVMPVERTGQDVFEFEYGQDFGRHIEAFDPTYPKALVRYNPSGDHDAKRTQRARLRELARWLVERDRPFMLELLVPPEPDQLVRVDHDRHRYDAEIRPALVRQAVSELQDAGVEPDVWKVEGLETVEDCEAVVSQCRAGGRSSVGCVVLGRGADADRVRHWLATAARAEGFVGFAIGRSIWWDAIAGVLAGRATRQEAGETIAERYLLFDGIFRTAQRVA